MPLLVSHRHRFLFQSIAKNASSTLRAELGRARFATVETDPRDLDATVRRDYFAFAFLRHPVSRFLSAYQEVSMRLEREAIDRTPFAFASLAEGPARLMAFLDHAEESRSDPHLWRQVDFLASLRLDFLGRIESMQEDLARVYGRLSLGKPAALPHRRSRRERVRLFRYDRFLVEEADLAPAARSRIEALYRSDLSLWRAVTEQHSLPDVCPPAKRSVEPSKKWQAPRVDRPGDPRGPALRSASNSVDSPPRLGDNALTSGDLKGRSTHRPDHRRSS